ncbi:hypothetical protein QMU85_003954, partial [Photobacterium damselae]|nr:hypothetical protein [Photobacterium damselae]
EPLLTPRKDFEEIIEFININYGYKCEIQIQTNATLINKSWIELFKKIKCKFVISISLDPAGFKNLRGIGYPDYIEKVWCKILLLQQSGIVVTIMSVAHKWNQLSFNEFVQQLVSKGVRYLTINKYESASFDNENFISEKEYNSILMSVAEFWIKNELYREIEIQPLMSLFSNKKNRLCQYLSDNDKCGLFITIYPDKKTSCDHLYSKSPVVDVNCKTCDIVSWCGGGCLSAIKDSSFCASRKNLKMFIEKIKNEN